MAQPEIGHLVPDFTLPGVVLADGTADRRDFTLSQHRGRPVVLAFYPGDETPMCTRQMCSYSNELAQFNELGAVVWGISPQGVDSHERFARNQGLTFPLLADESKTAVKAYGISLPGLGLRRSVFIVDAEGRLAWKHVALLGLGFESVGTLTGVLRGLA